METAEKIKADRLAKLARSSDDSALNERLHGGRNRPLTGKAVEMTKEQYDGKTNGVEFYAAGVLQPAAFAAKFTVDGKEKTGIYHYNYFMWREQNRKDGKIAPGFRYFFYKTSPDQVTAV